MGLGAKSQRGPGAVPLVRGEGAKPHEAKSFLRIDIQRKRQTGLMFVF